MKSKYLLTHDSQFKILRNGSVWNFISDFSHHIEAKIKTPDQAFYSKDGKDLNASDPDWMKYIPRTEKNEEDFKRW